ncbi:MAG: hypothetical protein H6R20_1250 [Proteobacteria bacterium]|nr:hypothetical protein [Pseudomonadota bacterium]
MDSPISWSDAAQRRSCASPPRDLAVEAHRERLDSRHLRRVDVIPAHELRDRRLAHVVMLDAPEQVVEDTLAQCAVGHLELREAQFREYRRHDRDARRQDCETVGLQHRKVEPLDVACLHEQAAQALESFGRDALVRPALRRDHGSDGAGGAGGGDGVPPADLAVRADNALHLVRRRELGLLHRALVDAPVGKVAQRVAHASHRQALHHLGLVAGADDEFRRAAADVGHQPAVGRRRERMGHAEIYEPRLLTPEDHLDGKA